MFLRKIWEAFASFPKVDHTTASYFIGPYSINYEDSRAILEGFCFPTSECKRQSIFGRGIGSRATFVFRTMRVTKFHVVPGWNGRPYRETAEFSFDRHCNITVLTIVRCDSSPQAIHSEAANGNGSSINGRTTTDVFVPSDTIRTERLISK